MRQHGSAETGHKPGTAEAGERPLHRPMDRYRRLFYCRYADDHILGFIGSKAEAEQIKAELARFLRETLALGYTGQDPDHPRPHWRGAVPRLRGHRPALQHATDRRPTAGQRESRAACPQGRDQGQDAPTGSTASRGTGADSRTWTTTTSCGSTERGVMGASCNYYLLAGTPGGWMTSAGPPRCPC